jgi:hypothetical protein
MFKLPPEPIVSLAGYAFLIEKFSIELPELEIITAIGTKNKKSFVENWMILSILNKPVNDTLHTHLEFALKFEGINLLVLSKLFQIIDSREFTEILKLEPNSKYTRQMWFLYEWLTESLLDIEDVNPKLRYENLVNAKLQYPNTISIDSKRHKIRNNLPGNKNFCPLIRRTQQLESFLQQDIKKRIYQNIGKVHPDLLMRAAAFLLLDDSQASYVIEGQTPPHNRAERWARIIGSAGQFPLGLSELEHLQKEVIPDDRFIKMGYRKEGGFIGTRDRQSSMPIPVHISAKSQDLKLLMPGLIEAASLFKKSNYPAILAATVIAFGFVFIHPFEDANGRIHRYLIHHVLSETGFTPAGIVFPISVVILRRILDYKKVLEAYSKPILPYIEWRPTQNGNVEILNETIDFYRYFDATTQAEFLCECIEETIDKALPAEIDYLKKYDLMKGFINSYLEMPDHMIDLLINFLNQNQGKLSKRARTKEFAKLSEKEVTSLETKFSEVFAVSMNL